MWCTRQRRQRNVVIMTGLINCKQSRFRHAPTTTPLLPHSLVCWKTAEALRSWQAVEAPTYLLHGIRRDLRATPWVREMCVCVCDKSQASRPNNQDEHGATAKRQAIATRRHSGHSPQRARRSSQRTALITGCRYMAPSGDPASAWTPWPALHANITCNTGRIRA